jgi:hypothetical protein
MPVWIAIRLKGRQVRWPFIYDDEGLLAHLPETILRKNGAAKIDLNKLTSAAKTSLDPISLAARA